MKKRRNIKEMKLKELRKKNNMRRKEKSIEKDWKKHKKSRLKRQLRRMQTIQLECKKNSIKNKMKFKKMLSYQYKRKKIN